MKGKFRIEIVITRKFYSALRTDFPNLALRIYPLKQVLEKGPHYQQSQ